MMTENLSKGLGEFASIRYIDADTSQFYQTSGGFLSLEIEPDEKYPRVNLHRAFPFTSGEEYLSVRTPEGKEIGIIRAINDFPKETVILFEEEINRRYFAPAILKVNSIKEEFSYSYWDVVTDAGSCRFTVRGGSSSITSIADDRLLIVDVDGNRFEIPDYKALDDRSYKKLEIFL